MCVRIDKDDDAVAHGRQRALQRPRFPVIFLLQQTHARIDLCNALDFCGSFITRTVINHNHFDLALVIS